MNLRAMFVWGVLLVAFLAVAMADAQVARVPVPDTAAQQEKLKLVRQLFKDELASAKKPDEQAALVRKMVLNAKETKGDPAGCLALLSTARDVALSSGGVELSCKVIDEIDQQFIVDSFAMRYDTLAKLGKSATKGANLNNWIEELNSLLDDALAADKFSLARQAGELGVDNARLNLDSPRATATSARLKEIAELESVYNNVKPALETLEKKPADPAANLQAGKYFCLLKGDWEHGLAMLALSKDPKLGDLAQKELKENDAAAKAALGDGWYELAEKETGLYKKGMLRRAYQLYVDAGAELTGLSKVIVDKRIKELEPTMKTAAPMQAARAAAAPAKVGRKTLISMVPREHLSEGALLLTSGDNVRPFSSRELFSYKFFDEYDLMIEFTRVESNIHPNSPEYIAFSIPHVDNNYVFKGLTLDGQTQFGIAKSMIIKTDFAASTLEPYLEKNKKYQILFEVRKQTLSISLDGKRLVNVDSYADLPAIHPNDRERGQLLLVVGSSAVKFHSISVNEISGPFKERPANPQQPAARQPNDDAMQRMMEQMRQQQLQQQQQRPQQK